MLDRWDRILLVVVLLSTGVLGIWAGFFPHSFYTDFPGGGRHWVMLDGPYNEHLVRDVGDANLGLAFVAACALWRRSTMLALVAAGASAVAWAPHLLYHLRHMDVFDTSDKIGSIGSLTLGLLAPVILGVRIALRGEAPSTKETNALT
jgi:hypothetical protein